MEACTPAALSLGGYGTATCPLIAENLVVIIRDRDDSVVTLAVDLRTGEKVWETSRPDSYGTFGTPIIWQNNDVAEVVVPGPLRLKGYALKTGKEDLGLRRHDCFRLHDADYIRRLAVFRGMV